MLNKSNDAFGLSLVEVAEFAEFSAHVGHRHVAVEGTACGLEAFVATDYFVHIVEQRIQRDERKGLGVLLRFGLGLRRDGFYEVFDLPAEEGFFLVGLRGEQEEAVEC